MDKETLAKLLDKAALICITKHAGQRDKAGCAYFQHPMRVAMRCVTDEQRMVAILHDIIEDTDITAEHLLTEGFPQSVVDGILSVTKREGESYEDFVARAKQNPIGRVVKLYDLEDNLNACRLDNLSTDMVPLYNKYLAARRFLLEDDAPDSNNSAEKIGPIDKLYSALRSEENKIIKSMSKHTGGTNRMRDRLVIQDRHKKMIINESSIFDTLCTLGRLIGFDKIEASDIMVKKGLYDYRLIRRSTTSNSYKRDNAGRWILSDAPVASVALALNYLFDTINARCVATILPR